MKPQDIDMKNWQWLPIDELVPYELNAKTHPEDQIRNLMQSLSDFGWTRPVTVDADRVIIIGHGIVLAAKALGLEKAPVVIRDDLPEDEVRKLRNLDNKLSESPWDLDLLQEDLQDLDLSAYNLDWGIQMEAETPESDPVDDEYIGTVPEDPKTKPGQLWKLGSHRLLCGDATSASDVQVLVGGGADGFISHGSSLWRELRRRNGGRAEHRKRQPADRRAAAVSRSCLCGC